MSEGLVRYFKHGNIELVALAFKTDTGIVVAIQLIEGTGAVSFVPLHQIPRFPGEKDASIGDIFQTLAFLTSSGPTLTLKSDHRAEILKALSAWADQLFEEMTQESQ